MIARLLVVVLLAGALVAVRALLVRRRPPTVDDLPGVRFPSWVTAGAERTWVVFTTPYCASCGPIVEHLEATDADARVITVDAGRHLDLTRDFGVRRAPTVFEADHRGQPVRRFDGADALRAAVPA